MPTITYNQSGSATEFEMDSLETDAKSWRDGGDKILHSIEKRYDVDAVQIHISWTVTGGQVDATIATLDNAISNFGADLPLASDAATVQYD